MTPNPSVIYATRIGGKTIDQDFCGGNPFATALLDALDQPPSSLRMLLGKTRAVTAATTQGLQNPVWKLQPGHGRWKIAMDASSAPESRQALVLAVSDYESAELGFLAGAAHDEKRVAAMLARHGFSVVQGVGRGRASVLATLRSFAKQTARADVALVYCTGHGAHTNAGTVVLPSDYPHRQGYSRKALLKHAVPIAELCGACQATSTNLVFFAGCRTRANGLEPAATTDPDAYVDALSGWQRVTVQRLRATVVGSAKLEEVIKWGHLVYLSNGPVLLIRAEAHRVLFGFWRGQHLREIEARLKPGGKYEMATVELHENEGVSAAVVRRLTQAAVALNKALGDPRRTT